MNRLINISKRSVLLTNRLPIQTSIRTALNNKDWRPKEELPISIEDREATAKKYNMLPEDYKSYPLERGAGDMPDVAPAGRYLERSPWEDYDYPLDRQNWNEPRHPDDHIKYDKTRLSQGDANQPVITKELFKLLLIPVIVILGAYGLRSLQFMNPTFASPKVEKGVVHYTFEKDDGTGHGVRY